MAALATTWDGLPISPDPPYGASIVVYRHVGAQLEFLILHRAHEGPDYAGEWAWTPPSGARLPNEPVDECARRELFEETRLTLPIQFTEHGLESWAIYTAQATPDAQVVLDAEHDSFKWVTAEEAIACCLPEQVGQGLQHVVRWLELADPLAHNNVWLAGAIGIGNDARDDKA